MRLPDRFLPHVVTITPHAGTSSSGPLYGEPFPLRCMAQGGLRIVRDADGTERLLVTTLYAGPGQAQAIPAGSQVTWLGASTTVVRSIDHDSGGLGAPDHTEVVCE